MAYYLDPGDFLPYEGTLEIEPWPGDRLKAELARIDALERVPLIETINAPEGPTFKEVTEQEKESSRRRAHFNVLADAFEGSTLPRLPVPNTINEWSHLQFVFDRYALRTWALDVGDTESQTEYVRIPVKDYVWAWMIKRVGESCQINPSIHIKRVVREWVTLDKKTNAAEIKRGLEGSTAWQGMLLSEKVFRKQWTRQRAQLDGLSAPVRCTGSLPRGSYVRASAVM